MLIAPRIHAELGIKYAHWPSIYWRCEHGFNVAVVAAASRFVNLQIGPQIKLLGRKTKHFLMDANMHFKFGTDIAIL